MPSIRELCGEDKKFKNHDSCGFYLSTDGSINLEDSLGIFIHPGKIGLVVSDISDDVNRIILLKFGNDIFAVSLDDDLFLTYAEKFDF